MNRSLVALLALVAGIVLGALIRASGNMTLVDLGHAIQPLGTLWLNALKMTLVPLIFAMVAKGMISLDRSGGGGRLLGITLPLLLGLLVFGMILSFVFGALFVTVWPVAPDALAPWMAASTGPVTAPPTIIGMIVDLVPSNPVAAAAQGNMAAIVVFAIIFGFAASRTSIAGNAPVTGFIDGLADAMIRIVQWVLVFTPLGIFVLSLGLALDTGFAIAGFLAQLVIASCLTSVLAIAVSYALAWLMGGVNPIRFGKAVLGAQAMAAGTCSSAATLPVMLECSEHKLGISDAVGGAVLPLAVSIFRFGVAFYQGTVVILLLHAAGMTIDPAKLAIVGAILILANLGIAGLPGAAVVAASWGAALGFLGLPLGLLPLLIAAVPLPDILLTVCNVTADLAVTSIVDRWLRGARAAAAALAAE
ncbi:MAG TPA: cation:dicarboxylase symporter family transporter [Rhizomicrobium sp.]|nr:cation:dicarboxylase symporter family transporter [Rhizomicrobium sp.]